MNTISMFRLTAKTQRHVLLRTLVGALSTRSSGRRFSIFVSAT